MNNQHNHSNSLTNSPSLEFTLNILLNRQEKDWGCFQVVKEGDFYSLYVPTLDSLKLYKNPKSENYKAYWRRINSSLLPDVKNRDEQPDIFIRNRSKQVEQRPKNSQTLVSKKQRIVDVKYRYNPCPEMYRLNRIVAQLIRDRLESNLSFDPATEIMPLVLVTEVES